MSGCSGQVLLLGLVGSLFCVLEKPATPEDGTISEMYRAQWNRLTNLCGCGPSVSETEYVADLLLNVYIHTILQLVVIICSFVAF